MPDYRKMYFDLFNAVTSAIYLLQEAQQKSEAAYIEGDDMPPFIILPKTADAKPKDPK